MYFYVLMYLNHKKFSWAKRREVEKLKCPDFYHIVLESEVTGLLSKWNIGGGFLITYE